MNAHLHLNSTASRHLAHSAPAQPGPGEIRVQQYGPSWRALVVEAGCPVRAGNIVSIAHLDRLDTDGAGHATFTPGVSA